MRAAPASLSASAFVPAADRKSTRLNSSHLGISYAVFCLKKKNVSQRESVITDATIKCMRLSHCIHQALARTASTRVQRGGLQRSGTIITKTFYFGSRLYH